MMRGWGGETEEGKRRRGCPSSQGVWGCDTRLSCRTCAYANMSKSHWGHPPVLPAGEAPVLFAMNEGEKCISSRHIQISRVLSTISPSYDPLAPEPVLCGMNLYEVCAQKQLKLCLQKDGEQRTALWKCPLHSDHTRNRWNTQEIVCVTPQLFSSAYWVAAWIASVLKPPCDTRGKKNEKKKNALLRTAAAAAHPLDQTCLLRGHKVESLGPMMSVQQPRQNSVGY